VIGTRVRDWDYVPAPPFVVQWVRDTMHLEGMIVERWIDFDLAVQRFFEYNTPIRIDWTGQIVDATGRRVAYWVTGPEAREMDPVGWMVGVRAVFEAMDRLDIGDAANRAVWEVRAEFAHKAEVR
jgi:hypothetical protein